MRFSTMAVTLLAFLLVTLPTVSVAQTEKAPAPVWTTEAPNAAPTWTTQAPVAQQQQQQRQAPTWTTEAPNAGSVPTWTTSVPGGDDYETGAGGVPTWTTNAPAGTSPPFISGTTVPTNTVGLNTTTTTTTATTNTEAPNAAPTWTTQAPVGLDTTTDTTTTTTTTTTTDTTTTTTTIAPTGTSAPTYLGVLGEDYNYYEDLVWTVCGDIADETCSARESATEIVSGLQERHEVRCCSDSDILGWSQVPGCDIWAASYVGTTPKCYHSEHFAQAEQLCWESGGRLCTRDEIFQRCTVGTGCGHEGDLVWTSSSASHLPLQVGKWVAKGIGTEAKLEQDLDAVYRFRCCSDLALPGWLKLHSSCDSYSTSQTPSCQTGSWTYANDTCVQIGGRLCTKEELMLACTVGTGCDFDQQWLWSGTTGYSQVTGISTPDEDANHTDTLNYTQSPIHFHDTLNVSAQDLMWAVCGDITEQACVARESAPEIISLVFDKHEVRCCSDVELPGWTRAEGCSIYAESEFGETKECFHSETFIEADQICHDHGGRLCTRDEIYERCTVGTGCGHEEDLIWSGTPIEGNYTEGYWAAKGYGTEAKLELDPDTVNRFRCCSDLALPGWLKISVHCQVWSTSQTPSCQQGSLAFAKETCAAVGGRLCTKEELMDACTVGTGCNYDQFFLWSGTKGYLSEFDTFEALKEGESSLPPSLLEIVGATLPPAFDIGGATETLPPAFEIGTITEDEDEIHSLPNLPTAMNWVTIDYENFEGGERAFWKPGSFMDAKLGAEFPDPLDPSILATNAVMLTRDNGDDSSMFSSSIDVSGYKSVKLDFWFHSELKGGAFYLESMTNLAGDYGIVKMWKEGVDFDDSEDTWYENVATLDVSSDHLVQLNLRLRCASQDGVIWFDHLVISVSTKVLPDE